MNAKKSPKLEALVVSAIRQLQDIQGSTASEIANYLNKEYNVKTPDLRKQVGMTLKRGLSCGILQKSRRGFVTCDKNIYDLNDESVSDCAACRKKAAMKRAKKSHRSRAKQGKGRKGRSKGGKSRGRKGKGHKSHRARAFGNKAAKSLSSGQKKRVTRERKVKKMKESENSSGLEESNPDRSDNMTHNNARPSSNNDTNM